MITQEELMKIVSYDKDTGIFTRLTGVKKGKEIHCVDGEGYGVVSFHNKSYRAHRMAWLYVYGKLPDGILDHINQIKNDNRICNLREATVRQNRYNCKLNSNNTSGYRGVSWNKHAKKWKAAFHKGKDYILVGYFDTAEQANKAYLERIKQDETLVSFLY